MRFRRNSARLLSVMFVGWLVASPLPSASAEDNAPALTRETVIAATRSGVVTVRLAEPLTVVGDNAAEVNLQHRGSVALVVLVQQGVEDPAAMLWASLPTDVACPQCPGPSVIFPMPSGHGELPAGEYRLYVLSEAGQVTASLTAPQLGGAPVRLEAQRHADAKLKVAAVTAAGPTLSMGGSTEALSAEGMLFRVAVGRSEAAVAMRAATCVHREGGMNGMLAYAPGCPTGAETEAIIAGAYVVGWASADFAATQGQYGQGGSVASTAPLDGVVIASAWLSY